MYFFIYEYCFLTPQLCPYISIKMFRRQQPTSKFPEWFWYEGLDLLVPLNNEAQRGELAAAVADQLVRQHRREDLL